MGKCASRLLLSIALFGVLACSTVPVVVEPLVTDSESAANSHSLLAGNITVSHRYGQTFVTWTEPHPRASYHVYRSNQPITDEAVLEKAVLLTRRWGPLPHDTSVNRYGNDEIPDHFVIDDLGSPLSDDTGLFVHTTQSSGVAYYAVTTFYNGNENRAISVAANATVAETIEQTAAPKPVLTVSANGGKSRIYTQFMDYAVWNPTFNGYGYNYTVMLPDTYSEQQSYPLQLSLHVFGSRAKPVDESENESAVIQLFTNDPGEAQGVSHSWWYGYAADHNYRTQGLYPKSGRIENFTEQRLIRAVEEVTAAFNVDSELIYVTGNSMGASGALSLGIRYPEVFAGVYASQPMTNYSANPLFQENFKRLWGGQGLNLPITNRGLIDAAEFDGIGVWDWMNHQLQVRSGRETAYLMMDFGKADDVIDWTTQGKPLFAALTIAKAAYSATAAGGIGHEWRHFNAVNTRVFGLGNNTESVWRYPNSQSFPALHHATGSGAIVPTATGDDIYNLAIDWSVEGNQFHRPIVDDLSRYEISLRSSAGNQIVDVTPRNTRLFRPAEGQKCQWQARDLTDERLIGSGLAVTAQHDLYTAQRVPVRESGTRLIIDCQ